MVAFSLAGAYCFRSRIRTVIFYSACLCGGLLLILNAEYIYTPAAGLGRPSWSRSFPGYDQALQLQTFQRPPLELRNCCDPTGKSGRFSVSPPTKRRTIFAHDAITESIISYGVVGLAAFVTVIVTVMSVSHRLVWQATNQSDRRYAALLLAFIFSNLFVGALMQSHINIFPVNFIFWICAGALLKITFNQQPIVLKKPTIDLAALAVALKPKPATAA